MIIKSKTDWAIVSTDICELNNKEMRQMYELRLRIGEILDNHDASDEQLKKVGKSRMYIGDDDLKLMFAILSVFTKDFASTQCSSFDNFLEELAKKSAAVDEPASDDGE